MILNLDQTTAHCAQEMVRNVNADNRALMDTLERLVTKTLGVLQEQGVYAMMLFLFSRSSDEKKIAPCIREPLYQLLKCLPAFVEHENLTGFHEETAVNNVLSFFSDHVCQDLDTLMLVRDMFEQALIYARFGAKAEG